ncbi:MAG: hypothetical protein U1E56_02340 [Bauldia sp.]
MDRVVAAKMIGMLRTASEDLDRVAGLAAQLPESDPERRRIVRAVGTVLGDIATELWHPMIAAFPDLDPPARVAGRRLS